MDLWCDQFSVLQWESCRETSNRTKDTSPRWCIGLAISLCLENERTNECEAKQNIRYTQRPSESSGCFRLTFKACSALCKTEKVRCQCFQFEFYTDRILKRHGEFQFVLKLVLAELIACLAVCLNAKLVLQRCLETIDKFNFFFERNINSMFTIKRQIISFHYSQSLLYILWSYVFVLG